MSFKAGDIIKELKSAADKDKAKVLARFFKTGEGEYGENDKFLGVMMPRQRVIAKNFVDIPLPEVEKLLKSEYHEARMTGLLILTYKYKKADEQQRNELFWFFVVNRAAANNWDLVDVTVPKVIGEFMCEQPRERKRLYKWIKSEDLWDRRIAVLATFAMIDRGEFDDSMKIAEMLLKDKHDLIHKAVGWMLREVAKKDQKPVEKFLEKHHKNMPRTMLRYAIERFSQPKRKYYMKS